MSIKLCKACKNLKTKDLIKVKELIEEELEKRSQKIIAESVDISKNRGKKC